MTRSDSSLGLFFPRVDSAKEGSAGALQFGSGHEPWMVFLPSLPSAPPVSKESVFHLTSCFFCHDATERLPDTLRVARRWCNVWGWERAYGLSQWSQALTLGCGPGTLLLQQMTAGPSPGWATWCTRQAWAPSGQQLLECSTHPEGLVMPPSLPKALIPLTPPPYPPPPQCQSS